MLNYVDKPQAKVSGGALAATAMTGVAGLVTGSARAGADGEKDDDSNSGLADAADLAVDVVGGVFDVLDLFS